MDRTISVFRACAGGYVGRGHVHPALIDAAREALAQATESGRVADGYVARCGDDIGLVLLHGEPPGSASVASLASEIFDRAAAVGVRLHQDGSNGGPPSVDGAELALSIRSSEPVLCFFSDKTPAGAWNVHLYRTFADPFNTPALVNDPRLELGFSFVVVAADGVEETFQLPADVYRFLAAAGKPRAAVRAVTSRATGAEAAAASAGSDPVLVVRCGSPFPGVEEALEAFTAPHLLGGISGSSPIVPVSANGDASTRSISRAVGLGFQAAPDRLVGPRDLFADAAFDDARRKAVAAGELLRGQFALAHTQATPSR